MRTAISIAFVAFVTACAGAAPRPQSEGAPYGRWTGFLERSGVREPMSVELTRASSPWAGKLSAGDASVPLEDVRVSGNNVHFEASGEGAFDGVVAGDEMAGSLSGPASGDFSLNRVEETWSPYFLGP
jgi:hypothetical protein